MKFIKSSAGDEGGGAVHANNIVRVNLFNLALYGKLFNSGIILVNLHWTPSINLI